MLGVACSACVASDSTGPEARERTPVDHLPCENTPNYADWSPDSIGSHRWAVFPLRVAIDRASMAVAGPKEDLYGAAIPLGLEAWARATGGRLGSVVTDFDLEDADVVVRLVDGIVTDEDWMAGALFGQWGGLPGGEILLYPKALQAHAWWLEENSDGAWTDSSDFADLVTRLTAHEMGHALGIDRHSRDPADVMSQGLRNVLTGSYPWITGSDLNTLYIVYCPDPG